MIEKLNKLNARFAAWRKRNDEIITVRARTVGAIGGIIGLIYLTVWFIWAVNFVIRTGTSIQPMTVMIQWIYPCMFVWCPSLWVWLYNYDWLWKFYPQSETKIW